MKKTLTFKQKLKRRLVFPLVIFFILFVILELAFILLEPVLFKGFYQYDPDMGFRVRPHAGNANSFGFNDKEWPLEKESGTYRIVILSDSFNWSLGREKVYVGQLGKMFDSFYKKRKVEVINIGYPMTHTGEQLIILKKFGLQFDPDLVCLGVFVGNDFIDAEPNRKRIVINDSFLDIDKRGELKILGYPIVARSRVLMFIEQKIKVIMELNKARTEREGGAGRNDEMPIKKSSFLFAFESPDDPPELPGKNIKQKRGKPSFSKETYLEIEHDRLEFFNIESHAKGIYDPNMQHIFLSIEEMSDLLEENDIGLIVAIYPDEFQVYESLLRQVLDRYELKREDFDIKLLQKCLRSFLEEKEIPYVDLLPGFREMGKKYDLYKLRDSHWNEYGNYLAAVLLYPELKKLVDADNPTR